MLGARLAVSNREPEATMDQSKGKKAVRPKSGAPVAPPREGVRRYDRPGHLDPAHARELLALGGRGDGGEELGFLKARRADDDLAEELAEEAVLSMTSGEDRLIEDRDAAVEEEEGGPFVVTGAAEELADGTDESNPEDATREPFPTT
jgi:hypothetical protein